MVETNVVVRPNLEAHELYASLVAHFESAWDAMALSKTASGRGNCMFGRQAMALLEWACRLSKSDASGEALRLLANKLAAIDGRYFTHLPTACGSPKGFDLPYLPGWPADEQLLSAMFDVIRNGLAHQSQQITVDLLDGAHWVMSLTGASYGATLAKAAAERPQEQKHLGVGRVGRAVFLLLRPDIMFLDFKAAIERAGLPTRTDLRFDYLSRGMDDKGRYGFGAESLEHFLITVGKHARIGIHGVTDIDQ